jgi:NAD(P) transhydrogenase subunit alpha
MAIGVPRESFPSLPWRAARRAGARRHSQPDLTKAGFQVVVESGAGQAAAYLDTEYAAKGAQLAAARRGLPPG